MIPAISNALILLGLIHLGIIVNFFYNTFPYFVVHKRWPPHPAELLREQEQIKAETNIIVLKDKLEQSEKKLQETQKELDETREEVKVIWKKTLDRLPNKHN